MTSRPVGMVVSLVLAGCDTNDPDMLGLVPSMPKDHRQDTRDVIDSSSDASSVPDSVTTAYIWQHPDASSSVTLDASTLRHRIRQIARALQITWIAGRPARAYNDSNETVSKRRTPHPSSHPAPRDCRDCAPLR